MKKIRLSALAFASLFVINTHAQFAEATVSYDPGTGFSPGFTNASSALDEPSRVTPGAFGGPVDVFNPPYLSGQLVSVGTGGSLTVKFKTPVLNHPQNRFGIDFVIFGNAGYIITNDFSFETFDWIGIPATDASLFGANAGETRVSVSRDGETFHQLNPALAPTVDGPLPTDGAGDFHTPVDPTLTPADLAGLTAAQIRVLYFGSAGGAGYDISWAQTVDGKPVKLPAINYIRVEVVSGKSEVDGFASVFVPPGHAR
jgi:hypothetical protein